MDLEDKEQIDFFRTDRSGLSGLNDWVTALCVGSRATGNVGKCYGDDDKALIGEWQLLAVALGSETRLKVHVGDHYERPACTLTI